MKRITRSIIYWTMALWMWVLPWHALFAQGIAHFNHVTWNAPPAQITSMKIYRGTISGGPYSPLVTISNPSTTTFYDDANTTQGVKHCYVMTNFIGTSESVFSAESCTVDLGTNVNPPTGVAVSSQ